MKNFLFGLLAVVFTMVVQAQSAYYQLPTNYELIGYQCATQPQFKVTGNDGTTQTGLVFAQCSQGGGRGGSIWHNTACANASWDESGNLLSYEVTAKVNSRTVVPSSWCFGQ